MLQDFLGHFTYAAVFGLLVAGGVGIPVPEELIQLTAGYLARRGVLSLVPGHRRGLGRHRRSGTSCSSGWGAATVPASSSRATSPACSPPAAGPSSSATSRATRSSPSCWPATPPGSACRSSRMAGASGVRSTTFLLADGLSALASVPLVVGAGWYFAGHIEELKREIRWVELAVALAAVIGAAAWVLLARRRERKAAGER